MIYLVASIASLIMLAAGSSVIALTLRGNGARIVAALTGQAPAHTSIPADLYLPYRARTPVRVRSVLPVLQPLRAAA